MIMYGLNSFEFAADCQNLDLQPSRYKHQSLTDTASFFCLLHVCTPRLNISQHTRQHFPRRHPAILHLQLAHLKVLGDEEALQQQLSSSSSSKTCQHILADVLMCSRCLEYPPVAWLSEQMLHHRLQIGYVSKQVRMDCSDTTQWHRCRVLSNLQAHPFVLSRAPTSAGVGNFRPVLPGQPGALLWLNALHSELQSSSGSGSSSGTLRQEVPNSFTDCTAGSGCMQQLEQQSTVDLLYCATCQLPQALQSSPRRPFHHPPLSPVHAAVLSFLGCCCHPGALQRGVAGRPAEQLRSLSSCRSTRGTRASRRAACRAMARARQGAGH
jgi:hypothetical protein